MHTETHTLFSALKNFIHAQGNHLATASHTPNEQLNKIREDFTLNGGKIVEAHNRRYLGNKAAITSFIRDTIESRHPDIESVCDIFAGTGSVANKFADKKVIANDLLYSNYVSNLTWLSPQDYRPHLILHYTQLINNHTSDEHNYMRKNFADTYFSAADCSKIGVARELIELLNNDNLLIGKEYEILITTVLYGMDRYANTVGHYDAYRKGATFRPGLRFPLILPPTSLNPANQVYNRDANDLIREIEADLLYLDPPYNSRQYSDAYHLLENVAHWQKPEVHGVAKKMDRTGLKSAYNSVRAAQALQDLVDHASCKYIAFSYNNMASKGNTRSNARISDTEIIEILSSKGEVQVFEIDHRPFSTGKSNIEGNTERLFICRVKSVKESPKALTLSPINYIGGKGKLLPQLKPLLPPAEYFVDLFAGGCNVGINASAQQVIFNDINPQLIQLMSFLATENPHDIIKNVDEITEEFGLSKTYESSYSAFNAESSRGLADYNKPGFFKLREKYNSLPNGHEKKSLLLYTLIIFGFNNQLRFNREKKFNLPVGKRDFNSKMRTKLIDFSARMQDIQAEFRVGDFRTINPNEFPQDTIFYCDPPYLITQATYNENGGWSDTDENDLLDFLDRVHASGRKFALSNVLEAKGRTNSTLKNWLESNPHITVHDLTMTYANSNYQRKGPASKTHEILAVNYTTNT